MRHSLSCLALGLVALAARGEEPETPKAKGKYDMTYDELANLKIRSSASLTATEHRKTPGQVTVITAEMIRRSGARNLGELLDQFVPDLQVLLGASTPILLTRSVLDAFSDKYPVLVNGVRMNIDFRLGNAPEFLLSALGDIERIEFLSGPGGAIYGQGAIAGVISIYTRNSLPEGKNEEVRLSLSGGMIERFAKTEATWLRRVNEALTFSIYAGLDHYEGADADVYLPRTYRGQPAGTNFHSINPEIHQSTGNEPRLKLHMELASDDFKTWLRYLRAGEDAPFVWVAIRHFQPASPTASIQYQQLTWGNLWKRDLGDSLNLELGGSLQASDYFSAAPALGLINAMDWNANLRPVLRWTPADEHLFAFGGELNYTEYGHRSLLRQGDDPAFFGEPNLAAQPRWNALSPSLFSEYQWRPSDQFALFLGGRLDQSKYAPLAFSPKIATVFTPTDEDTLTLSFNRSFRRVSGIDHRRDLLNAGAGESPNEEISSWEIAYKRQLSEHWHAGLSLYYTTNDIVGLVSDPSGQRVIYLSSPVGTSEAAGLTASLAYKDQDYGFSLSHNINELLDFTPRTQHPLLVLHQLLRSG